MKTTKKCFLRASIIFHTFELSRQKLVNIHLQNKMMIFDANIFYIKVTHYARIRDFEFL